MSAQENEALVRRFFEEVWAKGNVAAVDEFMAAPLPVVLSSLNASTILPSTAMSAPQHSYGNVSAPCDRIVSSGAPSMNVCPRVAGGDCGDAEALSVLIQINTRSVRLQPDQETSA
mgnify:CR=1 FL=1